MNTGTPPEIDSTEIDPTGISELPPAHRYFGHDYSQVQGYRRTPIPEVPPAYKPPADYRLIAKSDAGTIYEKPNGTRFTVIR